LNRDDTSAQDEYTYRAKWVFTPFGSAENRTDGDASRHRQRLRAYAIDNSRNTESDQPGVDSQHSPACRPRLHYLWSDTLGITAIAAYAKSIIKYSYDGDWGKSRLVGPVAAVYNTRKYKTATARRKPSSCAWVPKGVAASGGWSASMETNSMRASWI